MDTHMRRLIVCTLASLALLAFYAAALAAPGWQERVGAVWQERLQRIVETDVDAADGNPLAQMERWFSRQKSQDGGYCCSRADAYPFDGDYTLTAQGGVTFQWRDPQDGSQFTVIVPPEKMLEPQANDPNLTGGAVIWYSGVLNAGINPNLHCFALGKLG